MTKRPKLIYTHCPNCRHPHPIKYRTCGQCGFDLTKRREAQDALLDFYRRHGIGPRVRD